MSARTRPRVVGRCGGEADRLVPHPAAAGSSLARPGCHEPRCLLLRTRRATRVGRGQLTTTSRHKRAVSRSTSPRGKRKSMRPARDHTARGRMGHPPLPSLRTSARCYATSQQRQAYSNQQSPLDLKQIGCPHSDLKYLNWIPRARSVRINQHTHQIE